MRFEGGFQGRTNKLVDGCYSFWQGGVFPLLHLALAVEGTIAFYKYSKTEINIRQKLMQKMRLIFKCIKFNTNFRFVQY